MVVLAVVLLGAGGDTARGSTHVTLAVVPARASVAELSRVPGMGVGILSAGIGEVSAGQTYLDVGQGARVPDSLYDRSLPRLRMERAPGGAPARVDPARWREIRERADSAPADILPGLLGTALQEAGTPVRAASDSGAAASMLVDERGSLPAGPCRGRDCATVIVASAGLGGVRRLAAGLRGDDLLIALGRPTPASNHGLSMGIAGSGFDGTLTSDSTRMRGYVVSTDLAPTILERLGLPLPDEMTGEPIRADGSVDATYVRELQDRLAVVGPRRAPVIGVSMLAWLGLAALAAAAFRREGLRVALTILAVTLALAPAVLLVCAALEPSELGERVIVGVGCPVLAALVLWPAPGLRGLAIAAGASVIAYGVDVVAGSHLTELSLIGPNPAGGVRFYGIGNELEATVAALVPIGTGAALAGWAPRASPRAAVAAFALTGLVAVAVFAPGRFGADVGAAIGISFGAAIATGVCVGAGRRRLVWVIAAPLGALAALVAVDIALGGNAHLTRSVLRAGGLGDLGQVFQRRLELSAHSFARYARSALLWIVVALIVIGLAQRHRIRGWFGARRAALAGFAGAVGATLAGMLANDSGALLLGIGTVLAAATVGLVWATHEEHHHPGLWRPSGPVT